MESRNQLAMCRLCLCENECFINIFEMNDWQGYVAARVISDLLQCKVSETDVYPHVVCSTCLVKLTDFKQFKECCQRSKAVYDDMFLSSESPEDHQPEMMEFGTVKVEPIDYSDDKDDVSKLVIKHEKLDVDCTSAEGTKGSFDGINTEASFGPIPLKYEVLQFNRNSQEKMIESEGSGKFGAVELASTSMEDSRQNVEGREAAPEKIIGRGNKSFKCDHCENVLTTKQGLNLHLAAHGFGQVFKCSVCSRHCATKSALINHLRTHSNEMPYKCEVCHASFRFKSALTSHLTIHDGLRPFKCVVCSKEFANSDNLKRHLIVHTENMPFM